MSSSEDSNEEEEEATAGMQIQVTFKVHFTLNIDGIVWQHCYQNINTENRG